MICYKDVSGLYEFVTRIHYRVMHKLSTSSSHLWTTCISTATLLNKVATRINDILVFLEYRIADRAKYKLLLKCDMIFKIDLHNVRYIYIFDMLIFFLLNLFLNLNPYEMHSQTITNYQKLDLFLNSVTDSYCSAHKSLAEIEEMVS